VRSLKYMLLSKVMLSLPSDVYAIINGKIGIKYAGIEVEAMKAIANALRDRSIHKFGDVNAKYKAQLQEDQVVHAHLRDLYDNLLEQNLCRIIEPYSRVQINHIASLVNQPLNRVEEKLSQMILDKKISGILDQGAGVLIVFDEMQSDKTYATALETIQSMGKVVDALYNKAKKLT